MLVRINAVLLVIAFARWIGEPQVSKAIALENALDQARGEAPEPEMVSRRIQRGIGLLTGSVVYSSALGAIFGLVFAFSQGSSGPRPPRPLSLWLAAPGF